MNKALELEPNEPTLKEVRNIVKLKRKNRKQRRPNPAATKKKIDASENTLALRTDFSNDSAWEKLCALIRNPSQEFQANVNFISNKTYQGVTAEEFPRQYVI
ncbi:MAG TPA: hypothetical protein VME24_08640 [Alphaproteobacteria bacterium]|nr:hypothetical protein [Alphaproteobacteria bacterium]